MTTNGLNQKPFSGMEHQVSDPDLYDSADVASPDSGVGLTQEALSPEERERLQEEWKTELAKTEDEIQTLRQVLSAKVKHAQALKRKLGITPMAELKNDLTYGVKTVTESTAYRKVEETLTPLTQTTAYQKTSAALKTATVKTAEMTNTMGKKIGDLKNSNMYKSFEEKLHSGYSNVKAKMTGRQDEGSNFEELLEAQGSDARNAKSAPTTPMTETSKLPGS